MKIILLFIHFFNQINKNIMSIYKEQRIGVLVDIQNLYYSAKVLYQKKLILTKC